MTNLKKHSTHFLRLQKNLAPHSQEDKLTFMIRTSLLLPNLCFYLFTAISFASIKYTYTLNEDFENAGKAFTELLQSSRYIKIDGSHAISGKKSLVCDSRESSNQWFLYANFGKNVIEKGSVYEISFKYDLKACQAQSADCYFAIASPEKKFYARTCFAITEGQKDFVKFVFVVPSDAKEPSFRLFSRNPCLLIIDDLQIKKCDTNVNPWIFKDNAFIGMRRTPVHHNMLDLSNPAYFLPREKFMPFIDKYGQYKHSHWDSKITGKEAFKSSIQKEQKYNEQTCDIENRDNLGGLTNSSSNSQKSEGFTTCKIDDKWYLRTPEGNLFWSIGITCIGMFSSTPINDREEYFEEIDKRYLTDARGYKPGTYYYNKPVKNYQIVKKNIVEKYGENAVENYPQLVSNRMRKWGINTCGAWSSNDVMRSSGMPFTAIASSAGTQKLKTKKKMFALWGNIADYFSPNFPKQTERNLEKIKDLLENKNCIGVFVDNELSWQMKVGTTGLSVLSCPPEQPAKIAFKNMLQKKYEDISKLNIAWKSKYTSWDDFLESTNFEPKFSDAKADIIAFEKAYYERYFKICYNAVKKACPKALYLGCRFASRNELVERTAFEYCDVVSYNAYRSDTTSVKFPKNRKDKPVIIGEFHICRTDKGSPYGGLLEVKNAKLSAKAYYKYMKSAAENPSIVGAHWFQWFDMPMTGRADGANASCGFVSVTDEPDYVLIESSRKFAQDIYKIRLQK